MAVGRLWLPTAFNIIAQIAMRGENTHLELQEIQSAEPRLKF